MTNNFYVIYDCEAEEFGPVFEAKNDRVALRKCKIEFKDVPNLGDYRLYYVGRFDHSSGCIVDAPSAPSCLGYLSSIVSDKVKENS